jgi:Rrf2 family transcriptional regulator, iron-sulfur cluster assembly transcription factor
MSFLQVSRKVDYALRAVIHLANEEANDRACSVAEIAAREGIPRQFLEKIVQHLIHTGLVRSRRGPHGGYVLGRPAEQMTFRDVIESVEGPISLNVCVGEHPDCFLLGACGMNRVWLEGQRRVMDLFENTTIASVRHPVPATPSEPGSPEFPSQGGRLSAVTDSKDLGYRGREL